ncbi:cytochrome P450 2K1-like [Trichosurus vulpecula]|uniref:cytochrome P450 2K1-like n=1 Tax=Trichosurus vulpecula TaxID=9337 RepID=UPI00186B4659|nr:cytochrome P450 2K1-like [Trichosurus vulpecula]
MSEFDLLSILSGLSLILILILNIKLTLTTSFKKHSPPGPRPLPVIGNLHVLGLKRPYQAMLKLSQKYGSIFSLRMGPKKVVVLSGYETVKDALVNHSEEFGERAHVPIFEKLFEGKGISFSHGNNSKIIRRFTLTTLRNFGMGKKAIEERIVEECQHLIQVFESHQGKPFEISTIMNASTANIIASIVLGKRFDYQDPQFLRFLHLLSENFRLAGGPSITLFNVFPALGFLLQDVKMMLRNKNELFSFIRTTLLNYSQKLDENNQRTMIDAFLIRQQEEKDKPDDYFSNDNLMHLVHTLLSAGSETTSSTLHWGILLMVKYPEIQEKVHNEITKVVGSAQPRIEHRTQMPYTDAVIHEIQRVSNILPMSVPLETTRDVIFKNYYIPKGTEIIILLTSVLQDPTWWEKPYAFNPQHFLNMEEKFVKPEAFLPFSAGKRKCIGESLGKMELFLFFTSLLQKFAFHPPPGVSNTDLDLTPGIGFTSRATSYKICALPYS